MAGLAKEDGVAVSTEALASDFFRVLADQSRRLARGATHDTRDLATALVALLRKSRRLRVVANWLSGAAHDVLAQARAASPASVPCPQPPHV